ncbi:helix-turn-helix transcriptional regulator [Bradyrhizobium sp. LHD-71]|uniref:AraC family transcriptional regulator n=1 Tax=Bradyrhizobium sp. LHD-71 TaxID=3072141 RepID=UPI00280F6576|nr:helix-turn-helix transcriptional regulator [Bradyrhizobium sp. LHD-71]MDQ8728670.1 helix-turn-helix transcriptional regulator [Bradyrhizobium sp. LHD-71]
MPEPSVEGSVWSIDYRASSDALDGLAAHRGSHRLDDLGDIRISSTDIWLDQDLSVAVAGPPTVSLSLLLDGECVSQLADGEPVTLTAGSAIIFASENGSSGQNFARAKQRIRLVDMRFDRALLDRAGGLELSRFARELFVDRSLVDQRTVFISFAASKNLLETGRQLIECGYPQGNLRNLYLQAKALEALALSIAYLSEEQRQRQSISARDRQRLIDARQLLQDRFEEAWTISGLAKATGISEKKLKAGFRQIIGRSVHSYLREVRLTAAATMLNEGHSVTDVALSVGFANLSHFSKAFRELHGVNPSEYARVSS